MKPIINFFSFRPIRSNYETQGYDDNFACVSTDAAGRAYRPFRVLGSTYKGACPAGSVKLYPLIGLKSHAAKDFACWNGEAVHHSFEFPGKFKSETDMDGGIGVDVVSKEPIVECSEGCPEGTKHHVKARYWHNMRVAGHDGKDVEFGDLIAYGDSTGASSGPHVHYALKWCDENGKAIHTGNNLGNIKFDYVHINRFVLDEIKRRSEISPETKVVEEVQLTLLEQLKKFVFSLQMYVSSKVGGLINK